MFETKKEIEKLNNENQRLKQAYKKAIASNNKLTEQLKTYQTKIAELTKQLEKLAQLNELFENADVSNIDEYLLTMINNSHLTEELEVAQNELQCYKQIFHEYMQPRISDRSSLIAKYYVDCIRNGMYEIPMHIDWSKIEKSNELKAEIEKALIDGLGDVSGDKAEHEKHVSAELDRLTRKYGTKKGASSTKLSSRDIPQKLPPISDGEER